MKTNKFVAGGGAIELELSRYLRFIAKKDFDGKLQLVIHSFAKALEVIPRTIADNAGLDSVLVINKLRKKHHMQENDSKYFGVDINSDEGVCNTYKKFVWEPTLVKINAISSATEAACTILRIDETVKNPKSE